MKGIIERANHRFAYADSAIAAFEFIRSNVKVDLALVELKLEHSDGLSFIQRLKRDPHLRELPIVVYTAHGDRASVKSVLDLHVQNFLLKPYRDETIYHEIAKAVDAGWRQRHFASSELLNRRSGISPDEIRSLLEGLRITLAKAQVYFENHAKAAAVDPITEGLKCLAAKAVNGGALGIYGCLKELNEYAKQGDWSGFEAGLAHLEFGACLIDHQLRPELAPPGFRSEAELNAEHEAVERAWWQNAPAEERCPVVAWTQLQRQIEGLSGCPVAESIAASYQMAATGRPASLSPLLDLVQKDPSLTAEILIASNRLKKAGEEAETAPIEEPRVAVGLLGELRLAALGQSLVTVDERLLQAPPLAGWTQYRMFQLGTARLARFVCNYLEMLSLESAAYTAGLLHDIGKLILLRLHPFALPAIQAHAQQRGIKLAAAERIFLGVTTHDMAICFAQKNGLPRRFINVLRWMDDPEQATEDNELIAVVSLARSLCRHNQVGFSGDTPEDDATPLEETPEWRVLRNRVFLNFDLKKFERDAHRECLQLRRELRGSLAQTEVPSA